MQTQTTASADPGALVRELADRQELADLAARLGAWIDEKRFGDARALFVEDASVTTPGGTSDGVDALAAQAARNHTAERTHHVVTNVLVDLDGDRARIAANLVATFVPRADEPEVHQTHGERYVLDAVRTDARWKLSRVRVEPVWRQVSAPR